MSTTQASEPVKLVLRLDETMHERLTAEARTQLRSLNSQILWRLRLSFARDQDEAASAA